MKLYTEEQVRRIAKIYRDEFYILEAAINTEKPIELPSDEEILEETKDFMFEKNKELFYNGAKWLKDKILNYGK